MKIEDLDLRELMELPPKGGVLRFSGERAIILDTVALGILRKELIETVGVTVARGVLTRFGYAHGWRTAQAMRDQFPWDNEHEWKIAGGRLHTLQGLVRVEPLPTKPGEPEPFAQALWHDSYEAEQHLLHFGRADEPVCWTLIGFASGYMSYCNGRQIICVEERCVGRGDAVCQVLGKPREEWGDRLDEEVKYYQKGCLDAGLAKVTAQLKQAEQKLRAKKQQLSRHGEEGEPPGLVARSEAMQKVVELARRVARVDSTVLITGESGVGKERVARLIHDDSSRASRPFVAINCAAVTETLLESELFGHAKGSFTGATTDRAGLFEAAHGGTLFLDEVGEVPASMQAKLLRVLQEREVRRVGENKNRAVDVRVLAATNRDLTAAVDAGSFRKDLFYRLRVVELRIPPLRERRDDVLPLARQFLTEAVARARRKMCGISPKAADQLVRYDWPGNVRELENAMERAVALSIGTQIQPDDLPEEIRTALPTVFVPGRVHTLEDVEREYITAALRSNGGNRTKTAKQLEIGIATLHRKIKEYKLTA
ncbi:MAG: Response regulator of zinc sigma-54-dependent two-component system [Myxococcales bacterium]|nr:Response regulator of zinc sigma-54-dependent two-component system [Myxococcales bacterium]